MSSTISIRRQLRKMSSGTSRKIERKIQSSPPPDFQIPWFWGRSKLKNMANTEIQIVSSESGEPTAVIVPIELWREIESERETAYLLKSHAMKDRLLQASRRQTGLPLDAVIEKLGI
jgi:antitoxin YefM